MNPTWYVVAAVVALILAIPVTWLLQEPKPKTQCPQCKGELMAEDPCPSHTSCEVRLKCPSCGYENTTERSPTETHVPPHRKL